VAKQRGLVDSSVGFQAGKESRAPKRRSSGNKSGPGSAKLDGTPKVLKHFASVSKFGEFNSVNGAIRRGREPNEKAVNSETIKKEKESLNLVFRRNVDVDVSAGEDPRGTRRRETNKAPIRADSKRGTCSQPPV